MNFKDSEKSALICLKLPIPFPQTDYETPTYNNINILLFQVVYLFSLILLLINIIYYPGSFATSKLIEYFILHTSLKET